MKKKQFTVFILLIFAILSANIIGNAQTCPPLTSGCLDYTFGSGGTVFTNLATTDNNLFPGPGVMQSDGKIVALFDAHLNTGNSFTNVIIRYNTDGSLDPTFGGGGVVYLNWYGANNSFANAYAIAIQTVGAEEKIVVAGNSGGSYTLRIDRYNGDGSPDASFGSGGTAVFNAGYALTIAVQPDGKILTMGDVGVLVRLHADGTLDNTFGSGGIIQTSAVKATALGVQPTGKIIAAGYTRVKNKSSVRNVLTVARFNTNGSLDDGGRSDSTPGDSFGLKGVTVVESFGSGESIEFDAVGGILTASTFVPNNSSNYDFGVVRLTANGQLDSTFGSGGKATVDVSGFSDSIRRVLLQSDGKIVLTGQANSGQNAGIARLNADGTLDTSFGTGGKTVSDFSGTAERGFDGLMQFDPACACEKIVILGTAEVGGIDYALAARYLP